MKITGFSWTRTACKCEEDSCMERSPPEAHVLSAVIRVPGIPHCRGGGAALAPAHEPQGPRLLQTGLFQATKEWGP